MYVLNETDDYVSENITIKFRDHENDKFIIISEFLLLTIPSSVLFLSLLGVIMWTTLETSLTNKKMVKFLCPSSPVCCSITVPSNRGKSYFLTRLIFKKNFWKIVHLLTIPTSSWYPKLFGSFSNYIPINIIPNTLDDDRFRSKKRKDINIKSLKKQEQRQKHMDQ